MVLYWMATAQRGHENPALDVALFVARSRGLPVLVYQGIAERYPYASDRHHRFLLEGCRDVAQQLAARGIRYAVDVQRPGHRGAHLRELARRSALIVTEDFPCEPLRGWANRLASRSEAPLWFVDTACVVPMQSVGRAHRRAFEFRQATREMRPQRLARPWPEQEVAEAFRGDLPFEPVDLATADLDALVAACDVDHSVPAVAESPGGSHAGYARWDEFRDARLERYERDRNDPLRRGVSRLSPYLHLGQVSPLRIAREAAQRGGRGADKYLDELLVWRELAYGYCFYRPDHDGLATLPDWARQTLRQHQDDPREILGEETLARARTGDALWDAAQRSLLRGGELHNNVRMTWGKAIPHWSRDAAQALRRTLDLNHRYALDGRDPASSGGILWCLGEFDRPFTPETPVLGRVRGRSTATHARRLDVRRYQRSVAGPYRDLRVAVVGGGLTALTCARFLQDQGVDVRVLDKARRPCGRLASWSDAPVHHDRGAQYFTVRSPRFARAVRCWEEDGVVAPWTAPLVHLRRGETRPREDREPRLVGAPSMDALAVHLADTGPPRRQGFRVEGLVGAPGAWWLAAADGREGPFDAVLLTVPAPQAVELLAGLPGLQEPLRAVQMAPCLALGVTPSAPLGREFGGAFVEDSPLSWIAAEHTKPGRSPTEAWMLHVGPEASAERFEEPDEVLRDWILDSLREALGGPVEAPTSTVLHRWRHALTTEPLGETCRFDPDAGVGVGGDWCLGARVEAAYLSGEALAGRVLAWARARRSQPTS